MYMSLLFWAMFICKYHFLPNRPPVRTSPSLLPEKWNDFYKPFLNQSQAGVESDSNRSRAIVVSRCTLYILCIYSVILLRSHKISKYFCTLTRSFSGVHRRSTDGQPTVKANVTLLSGYFCPEKWSKILLLILYYIFIYNILFNHQLIWHKCDFFFTKICKCHFFFVTLYAF